MFQSMTNTKWGYLIHMYVYVNLKQQTIYQNIFNEVLG